MRFVDTNVLLYVVSGDPPDQEKRDMARTIVAQRDLAVSAQVLQEFYVQSTRASRKGALTPGEAADFLTVFARFPGVVVVDPFR